MERIIKIIIYVLLVCAILGATSFYYTDAFYHSLVAEDGIFENITALILLAISVLFLIRFFIQHKTRSPWWKLLNILIIVGAFFGFGEEISWGQRIFSIESGEFFTANNIQSETNLHNLEVGGVNINKLIFSQGLVIVFGFYFVFAQLLYRKWGKFTELIDVFGLQLPKIKHSVVMLLVTVLILLIPDKRIWELWEAMFVIILLWVFTEPWNSKEKLIAW
jgi:hypothetical protein